jgi:alpha-beta hydrolase superfamily lysophospholipase
MQKATLDVNGYAIEYIEFFANKENAPTIVFLHEGLGCIALWKDFPQRVAQATGCRVVVYSRYGYGQSSVLQEDFKPDYMHREALEVLPEFLRKLNIVNPILFGHSDGGSIALIHAGAAKCIALSKTSALPASKPPSKLTSPLTLAKSSVATMPTRTKLFGAGIISGYIQIFVRGISKNIYLLSLAPFLLSKVSMTSTAL